MADEADRLCGEIAYGDVKRLELAIALANRPKLLLMDEPAAGMAPGERRQLMSLTEHIARERDIGVLFTEHDMDIVFGHADRVIVLNRGELIAEGSPKRCGRARMCAPIYLGAGALHGDGAMSGRALSVSRLNADYGRARVLFDVSLEVARRRSGGADRAQRRRQVDDDAGHPRAHQTPQRRSLVRRARHFRLADA